VEKRGWVLLIKCRTTHQNKIKQNTVEKEYNHSSSNPIVFEGYNFFFTVLICKTCSVFGLTVVRIEFDRIAT
jgi:hypothetical protein